MSQQIGIIDLGSNSARMIVMHYQPHHSFKLLDEVKETVRLAHDVGDTNELQQEPMQRAIETLKLFVSLGKALNVPTLVAVTTSAVRDALNRADFLARVKQETGLVMRVLSGDEEAYYAYLGAINSLPLQDGYIFDLGGGSVELALVRGRGLAQQVSLPLGTIRLTEGFFQNDPPTKAELKALDRYLESALDDVPWLVKQNALELIGIGGTVRNLAKMDQRAQKYPIDHLHGYHMSLERVEEWANRLSKMSRAERETIDGINNDRIDILVGGILLIRKLMQRTGAKSLWICSQGLRDGLFYEHFLVGANPPLITNLRQFSIDNLARLYEAHIVHANKVRDLSWALFDQLSGLHGYGSWEREILGAAALLHDIGVTINYYDHHKHGLYLLLNTALNGFDHRELAMIALLVRHHRKGGIVDEGLGRLLQQGDVERLSKLAALLRIAEYLERSKSQVVQNIRCQIDKDRVRIKVQSLGDATVEIWDANRRSSLFRKAYGTDIIIEEEETKPPRH